jgi:16S rRNA (guanine527-N7)-methyltransferase
MSKPGDYDTENFVGALKNFGITPYESQIRMFIRYYDMLTEWNRSVNLTAITDFDGVMIKHFADSASFAVLNLPTDQKQLIDIGTGAGFPGIPLKILFPELQVTLMDSLNKRIAFLNAVIGELGLTGIQAIHMRAEDAGRNNLYREQFDYCVSRAVANLATLSEYCIPLIKTDGIFVSYKSADTDKELEDAGDALLKLNAKIEKKEDLAIDCRGENLKRCLVVIRKTGPTPEKYPRKAGIPSKRPLK